MVHSSTGITKSLAKAIRLSSAEALCAVRAHGKTRESHFTHTRDQMAATKLQFTSVPSIPNLKVIERFTFPSGEAMLVTSTSPHSIHFSPIATSPKSLGEITVSGPNVVNIALELNAIMEAINAFRGGVEKGLKEGCTTHTHIEFNSNGQQRSFDSSTSCSAG
jgi:hypothetical protein